ncbi:PREDICTED: uncharacterized protein LOC105568705 [Vollenhovia emeryi]|uniref:uncharacterized protein LOC105568705 n=1 Tax=Vollenhovia emeryi TaxID=411798 RepID=UPI0005F55240|nr:PREDICTED: uncharacterized protein LOC105568705 [Vollenhovia emeryi]
MEQQREAFNIIMIFLLMVASIHDVSSSLYTITTTIDIGDGDQITDRSWPLNTTASIYQDSTTYLPTSASIQGEEILHSSETNVLNQFVRPSHQRNEYREDDDPEEPPDHVIPYSDHEEARDVPTQPKYVGPGIWAKPPPEKDIPLDFVPTKLHAQVRGSHTVRRVPQRQAIESAETEEERRNAPRLRAVVTNSKVNTVYTEEGYEDSAYDHAGHIRDADFHEGFAHKLHNRKNSGQNSSSAKNREGKNSIPDEFKEYEEDYQDHMYEKRKEKFEEADDEDNLIAYDRNGGEESELNPKFVAENNIGKLEEDVEKDAEEAERNSKIYQRAQESKLRNDIKVNSSELEESRVEDNLKHENKSVKTKKRKSKLRKNDNVGKKTKSRKSKNKKLLFGDYETTVLPFEETSPIDVETPASPHGFVTSSPNSQIYSVDQTTLRYVAPIATAPSRHIDEPTTVSYSQLFWDYFKARQGPSSTEPSELVSNSTTMNPQQEAQTPVAVATIDGHGPYLLVTKEETSPSTFLAPSSFRPRNLFSDHVEFGPTSAQTHSRHLLGQSGGVDYVSSVITTSTVRTFTSVPSLSPVEDSTSTLLDTTASSSTPAVVTLNFTKEAYARIAEYHENPFLSPVLDNSNIAVTRNKLKYRVLARAKPSHNKKPVKSVTQSPHQQVSSSSSKEENEYSKIRDDLNAKYNKMLNYIKNNQETQSFSKEKKTYFSDDLTLRRPPIQQATYSIFLTDHPSPRNRSSISTESESPREANWRNELQNQHRSQPARIPFRFDPFAHVQPVHPVYRKNSLPTTKLLPPPLQLATAYANYRSNKQNDNHHSHLSGKPQRRDNPFRYFPLNSEASWRSDRRKRSDEGEFRDGNSNAMDVDVKAAANNGVTNDTKSEQQDKSSFDRVIDRSEGKLPSRRAIDAPIDVPDGIKLVFSTRWRGDESGTSNNKNSTISIGERKNATEIIIDISKIDNKGSILIQSAKQNGRINDTTVIELAKKKRDIESEADSINSFKNKVNENNHEELLNESPKISGDVIDKEIATRFNEKENEASPTIEKNGKIEVEIPSFDYVEELVEEDLIKDFSTTTEAAIDLNKYPFYNNEDVPSASALKYVVDPATIPRKTSRGMAFYDSRNAYKQCDEVESNLDKVLPEKEEPDPERGPQEDLPRLRGLGNKLDCFKAKYFDENPLDNPLFGEKLVGEPTPPTELNPTKFSSKIMVLPEENDEYVVPQVSKKPEQSRSSRQWRNRIRPYETLESIRVNYKHDPQTGRGRDAYLHTVRGTKLSNMMRRVKNRKFWSKIPPTTTPSPKFYQTDSYQNQVYEDVMGNIRNMKNIYQVYEMTTLPPPTQILATAGSENTVKVVDDTSEENITSKSDETDVTDVINNTKSLEIKGLVPPPKYLIHRQTYRKHRPLAKSRVSFIRSPTFPRIIAHHHTIKLNKRSTTDDTAKNSSESIINDNKEATVNGSTEVAAVGNDTLTVKLIEKATNKTNVTTEPLDLEIEESRPISVQDRSLSTILKINDKKKRRNSTSSDFKSKPQKTVYTIRDRIRYSKPKWDTRGFGKFTTSSKTVDEDSRRKEPRYNRIERKNKPVDDRQNNPTIMNSTENTSGIESATSLIEDRESSTTEAYHAEESAVQQMIYHKKDEYPEVDRAGTDVESVESFFEEDEEESTTNTYQVRESVNENVSTTTARSTDPQDSKEVLNLREYLESDPPGYAETFPEEATTPSSKYRANVDHESEDSEEKQEEETDYPRGVTNPWENDSSEKMEEQVETTMKTRLFSQDDDSEELSSKEEEGTNKDQTFFTYTRRPLLIESDKDDGDSEKETVYKPFPFSRYKSKFKKGSEENNPEEESEEKSEDYVFPWHADKENKDGKRWLHDFDRYEYPWEKRDRLARERRKRKHARIYDDEDEEESTRYETPIYPWQKPTYPWERYNVPSKIRRVNTRRDVSRRNIDDSEESTTEYVPFTKYSSRYSSSDVKPKVSSAHEISRSIQKFLEDEDEPRENASKEIENHTPSFAQKSPSSDRGISRGMLVPEDITQPPRRKNARRKASQVDRNATNNSRFDSKKLRSEDVINEGKEEEPMEYLKLNKSDLDDTEVTSVQPSQSDGTKEVPSATEQRKKRRRKVSKNNFPVSLDNASAASVTEPTKKRRRRPETLTTTSTTPSTSIDFGPRKSTFTPNRKRYSKKGEKTNRSDFSEKTATAKTIATPKSKTDNSQVETSTPKTRTIEHLSRVSKEKIVTKTTYPNETENFDSMKTSVRKQPVKRIRLKVRKNNNKQDGNNFDNKDSDNKTELVKQEDKEESDEDKFVNGDEIKKSASDKPQDKSRDKAFKHFGMKKEEVKKINDFGTHDGIVNDENDNDNSGIGISSESYAIRNLMRNIPPNRGRSRANERTQSESDRLTEDWKERNYNKEANEEEKKKNVEQKRNPLMQTKFIKDPGHRLYYYVERK